MATRRDLLLAVIALTGVSLLIAFGSIGLFTRMTPELDELRATLGAEGEHVAQVRRLGQAGAWAAAIVGLFACLLGIAVYLRLERRIAGPTSQLARVLTAVRSGDAHERCHAVDAEHELGVAIGALNQILDRGAAEVSAREAAPVSPAGENEAYRALILLLTQKAEAAALVTPAGAIIAATPGAVARFMDVGGAALRDRVTRVAAGDVSEGLDREVLDPERIVLVKIA